MLEQIDRFIVEDDGAIHVKSQKDYNYLMDCILELPKAQLSKLPEIKKEF